MATGAQGVVDDGFIAKWVDRLREVTPDAVAVILKGSYARGNPGPYSDVDFDVLTAGAAREEYPAFLEEVPGGRLVHVSVAVSNLAGWLAEETEPAGWSFGLPASEAMRLLWAVDDALTKQLDRRERVFPGGEPELEDFVAGLGKVTQARTRGDGPALRLAAQDVASLCPSLLQTLNPAVRAGTRSESLQLALTFPISPPHYREDMLTCLGLTARASSETVHLSAVRLVHGVLELLQPQAARLAPLLPPDLAGALARGTLRRYVAQLS